MNSGFRKTAAIASVAALLLAAGSAMAQAPKPPAKPGATPGRPGAAPPPPRTGECAALPGGRAPVEKIAALTTGLSPRDLDLMYFNKRLADLSDTDFAQIGELSGRCGQGAGILAPEQLQQFETVVREAQQMRQVTLGKLKKQMNDITALPVARDKLARLNGLTENLPLLEPALTKTDIGATATWINRQMQAVYDIAPRSQATVQVVPPMPAPIPIEPPPGFAGRRRIPGGEEF